MPGIHHFLKLAAEIQVTHMCLKAWNATLLPSLPIPEETIIFNVETLHMCTFASYRWSWDT